MKRILINTSRYLVAIVFIFSGFVKCVDPTGTAIKMEEYLAVFGMEFLNPFVMAFSVLMCGAELLIGIMLLTNLRIRWAIWSSVALMAFYTPLTLWLAISNKVTDCGCFGDALVLTNWETFLKNVVIDGLIVVLVLYRKEFREPFKAGIQWILTGAGALLVLGFEFFNLTHLPVIDFMPYKIGANIPASMAMPENAPRDSFEIKLLYEKDGIVKEFTTRDYPQTDDWKFVDSKSKLVRKGYEPPIHDFNILSADGQDVTEQILSDPGYSLLVIFHSLRDASLSHMDEINSLADRAISRGYKVYGLTSSVPEEFEAFREKARFAHPMFNMDGTTLKTMMRPNPGVMVIRNGTIMAKRNHRQASGLELE